MSTQNEQLGRGSKAGVRFFQNVKSYVISSKSKFRGGRGFAFVRFVYLYTHENDKKWMTPQLLLNRKATLGHIVPCKL